MKIGIDLGGTHIAVGVISEKNTLLAKREMDIFKVQPENAMKEYIVDNIKLLIGQVLRDVGAPSCVISKIGIAMPGKIKENIAYDMYNLGIKEFDIAAILKKHYGVEVSVRNDAKCAALAEKELGNLKDYEDCVFLCLGTGIGGATFINGKMLDYTKEWCSEFGHMIICKDGIECSCGNRGCWEKYGSMKTFKNGIIKELKLPTDIESERILEIINNRIRIKDEIVEEFINKYINEVMIGIKNIINILQPEAICIGGGFTYFSNILYPRLIQKLNLEKNNGKTPKIEIAKLGNDAGIIGSLL